MKSQFSSPPEYLAENTPSPAALQPHPPMSGSRFHFRDVCRPEDVDFILAAADSTLLHLASIGSGDQWGSTPFSEREDRVEQIQGWISSSEAYRLGQPGSQPHKLFIAEVEVPEGDDTAFAGLSIRTDERGRRLASVGVAGVREHWWPKYVAGPEGFESLQHVVKQAEAEGGFFYLDVLLSDFRASAARRGVGAALLEKAREYSVSRGAKVLFLDCWAGNSGNLVKYRNPGFRRHCPQSARRN